MAANHKAELGGLKLTVMVEQRWVQFLAAADVSLSAATATEEANRLRDFVPQANVSLEDEVLRFLTGQDLLDMVNSLKAELKPGEVTQ